MTLNENVVWLNKQKIEQAAATLRKHGFNVIAVDTKEEARKLAQQHGRISASFLQRHLRIGYPRAARLMEQLEDGEDADDAVSDEDRDKDWQ